MRKTVLITITASALVLTGCTTGSNEARGGAGNQAVVSPITGEAEAAAQLDDLLLSNLGVSSWEEATEGWARDVTGTAVNGSDFLVNTTFQANDSGVAEDAERIGSEVVRIVSGDPAVDQIGRVTVTYADGRGAYFQQL